MCIKCGIFVVVVFFVLLFYLPFKFTGFLLLSIFGY